ncbi:hypothetical protein BG015_001739 [Linnemannia schmuckeri]|uniref:Uncharacterized protein n=1 Tax=Linnemannia schmuckeri TaxID=64567 RepID=A0A9P5V6R4_9FUNG|nr:hypothetical protein BG015_001739 [Linnemannia schmuckeri]
MRGPASWKKSLLATVAGLASIASIAQADIICGSPNTGQSYKAGDPMTLAIAASPTGGSPFVAQVDSLTAKLICAVAGNTIDTITIPKANVTAYNYVVPSVGNEPTAPVSNKFYVTYSGRYTSDGLIPIPRDFGPADCAAITIVPEPFYIPPTPSPNTTTTISTSRPTGTTTSKGGKTTTTTTSSLTPTPTPGDKGESESQGRPKTFIVVIVAIVAVVILALMAVGIMFHLRRQRRRRMESAIMPWSNQNNNQFSKMSSSMDEDNPRSPGSHHAAAMGGVGGVAAAGAVGAGYNKPQPKIPQSSHGQYYGDDSYGGGGYGQQQQRGHGGYYDDQDGYVQQQQDDYYNPYYAQHAGGGGGYQGGAAGGAAAAGGYGYRNDKQSYYAGSIQGGRTPYQEPHDPYSSASPPVSSAGAGGASGGYYPPPPPVSSNAAGAMSPPTPSSTNLNSAPNELSSATLTNSSGTGRAPQVILPEIGQSESGDAAGGIPMKEIPSK